MDNVYIIIVSYNGMKWLPSALSSIPPQYQTIVVDNASVDDTVSYIRKNHPKVIIFEAKKNLGFGQANNVGISYAQEKGADYLFLLNQDAYFVEDTIESLLSVHKEHTEYGILSPIHLTSDKKRLDYNFSRYLTPDKNVKFYSDHVLKQQLAQIYDVPMVNAAAWLLSKKCIDAVGGFDPIFFHYGEDDNYCQRVLYHGFKIGVVPNSFIIHDRQDRPKTIVEPNSPKYFKILDTKYKVQFSNINKEYNSICLEKNLRSIVINMLKALMKLNFKGFNGLFKEYFLFKRIIPEIINSRKLNKIKGRNYLTAKQNILLEK